MMKIAFSDVWIFSTIFLVGVVFLALLSWWWSLKKPSKEAVKAIEYLRRHNGIALEAELRLFALGSLHSAGEWLVIQNELIRLGVIFQNGRVFFS